MQSYKKTTQACLFLTLYAFSLKMRVLLTAVFLLLSVVSVSLQDIHYVIPNDGSTTNCPGSPCLSINHYAENTTGYFTNSSTFIFLAGNHSATTTLVVTHVYNLTLQGDENEVKVAMALEFVNVTDVRIIGITFYQFSYLSILFGHRVSITNCTFLGGRSSAIIGEHSNITFLNCTFKGNRINRYSAVIDTKMRCFLTIHACRFTENEVQYNGVIHVHDGSIALNGNNFTNNTGTCILCYNCSTSIGGLSYFVDNKKSAVYISKGSLVILGTARFIRNRAERDGAEEGGAINANSSNISFNGSVIFEGNSAKYGGAMRLENTVVMGSYKTLKFIRNSAQQFGGAIYVGTCDNNVYNISEVFFMGETLFDKNTASSGGAIMAECAKVLLQANISFSNNSANLRGGAICASKSNILVLPPRESIATYGSNSVPGIAHFLHNQAEVGGAIDAIKSNVSFHGSSTFENNSAKCGGALTLSLTSVASNYKSLKFVSNSAQQFGGAIYVIGNSVIFKGHTILFNNTASIGGAVKAEYAHLSFQGIANFSWNTAKSDGGAIHASASDIELKNSTEFRSNSGVNNGGAMFINSTRLIIASYTTVNTYMNSAKNGGMIYHNDAPTSSQCNESIETIHHYDSLPECFLELIEPRIGYSMYSYQDTAENGSFLYGGLLDRCKPKARLFFRPKPYKLFFTIGIHINSTQDSIVTSKPYRLCFCPSTVNVCNTVGSISVHRGQIFSVYLQAVAQGGATTAVRIKASTSQTSSRLKVDESIQTLSDNCAGLIDKYAIYSTKNSEDMNFQLHSGLCQDAGFSSRPSVLHVTLLPCPHAFKKSGDECTCEERLLQYNATCTIGVKFTITRISQSTFWMSALYNNGSYLGLILYKTCPTDYCVKGDLSFTLDDLDLQCTSNRSGMLCGACASNYSLLLGSSRCAVCPNTYMALLLPLALAGICLVAFLSILKLTVATGMLNSLIMYANIIQANRGIFFPEFKVNVLTVFIAWLNLDLGFETCFYDGMDSFVFICLQFIFPVFVWILICLIIFTSRYSITVSKLIGHNPIAVLATLLLMSYTKILKIIIDVFSSVNLVYPDPDESHNTRLVTVWLKDANEPYLRSRHLILTIVTCFVLVIFFLPYTLFLLLGHRLYRLSGRKYFRWLNRFKPLLDSYHAPYNVDTRYWTGLLLLVRCVLYIVFSYNSLGGTSKSLLAIIIVFTALVSKVWFSGKIYKKLYMNIIEVALYLNIITLSAFTQAQLYSTVMAYLSVGAAFVTMLAVIVHHFFLRFMANTMCWQKMKLIVSGYMQSIVKAPTKVNKPQAPIPKESHIVSKTVINLQEPLLEY